MNNKNLIITVATNFKPTAIERFVKSFRFTNTDDHICICINHNDSNKHFTFLKEMNRQYNVDFFLIDDSFLTNKYYIQTERFKIFIPILKSYDVANVFMCDSRDVIFQRNIFEYKCNKLIAFEEADIIANESFNTFVIKSYCNTRYELIKNKKILNVGTLYGEKDYIIHVCNKITELLNNAPVYFNHVGNPYLYDQAVYNIAVYTGLLNAEYINVSNNSQGIVNTIGLQCAFKQINNDGFFTNINGDVCYVVHQFDRCTQDMLLKLKNRGLPIEDLL
jgi:hypothetical protein